MRSPPVPGLETYQEKATRKFKENPWVPLGSLATVGALITAMVKMRRGESRSFNHWLRVRVAAQGLTIVALVAGTYSLRPKDTQSVDDDPTLTRNDVDVERRRLEKVAKEKAEFEERMKSAEVAHDMEDMLRGDKRRRNESMNASGTQETNDSTTPDAASTGRWWGWFGRGSGAGTSTSTDSKKP